MDESQRIEQAYEQVAKQSRSVWTYFNAANVLLIQERERTFLRMLNALGWQDKLQAARVLDVGCGTGDELAKCLLYGAKASNLVGIDLSESRIEQAREKYPNMMFRAENAAQTPWPDGEFDLIYQMTCFSSMLTPDIKEGVAQEICRLLKPGGLFVWYDMKDTTALHRFVNRSAQLLLLLLEQPRYFQAKLLEKLTGKTPSSAPVSQDTSFTRVQTQAINRPEVLNLFKSLELRSAQQIGLPFYGLKLGEKVPGVLSLLSSLSLLKTHEMMCFQKPNP